MKQYTRKQLREFVRLGLAVNLTEAEPEKIPASYTKVRGCSYEQNSSGRIYPH